MTSDPEGAALVHEVTGEIAELHYAGEIKGIAAVMVLANGNLRTIYAHGEGSKLSLLAGSALLQSDLVQSVKLTAIDGSRLA